MNETAPVVFPRRSVAPSVTREETLNEVITSLNILSRAMTAVNSPQRSGVRLALEYVKAIKEEA